MKILLFFGIATIVMFLIAAKAPKENVIVRDEPIKWLQTSKYFRCYKKGKFIDSITIKSHKNHLFLAAQYFKQKHGQDIYIL